jgi:hypothetical protein
MSVARPKAAARRDQPQDGRLQSRRPNARDPGERTREVASAGSRDPPLPAGAALCSCGHPGPLSCSCAWHGSSALSAKSGASDGTGATGSCSAQPARESSASGSRRKRRRAGMAQLSVRRISEESGGRRSEKPAFRPVGLATHKYALWRGGKPGESAEVCDGSDAPIRRD